MLIRGAVSATKTSVWVSQIYICNIKRMFNTQEILLILIYKFYTLTQIYIYNTKRMFNTQEILLILIYKILHINTDLYMQHKTYVQYTGNIIDINL